MYRNSLTQVQRLETRNLAKFRDEAPLNIVHLQIKLPQVGERTQLGWENTKQIVVFQRQFLEFGKKSQFGGNGL